MPTAALDKPSTFHRARQSVGARASAIGRSSKVGWTLAITIVIIAIAGPYFAPHSPSTILGAPFARPSHGLPLGTDVLGRDVLSRALYGGRSVLTIATLATIFAYSIGVTVGLSAGYRGGVTDTMLMRTVDLVMSFPAIIFVLLLVSGVGSSRWVLIFAIGTVLVPGIARVVRAATLQVVTRPYIDAALVRGERTPYVLFGEILPNIVRPISADIGIRFTGATLLAAGVNFLGLGLHPPAADWGLMVAENSVGLQNNAWATLVPALLIAMITISGNLIADGLANSLGRDR
jgi:peptide/nickel transport system permease protein